MTEDWKRLGNYVAGEREYLNLTQQAVYDRGGPSVALIRQLEKGTYSANMHPTVRRGLERALNWAPGSVDEVLTGGEPDALPTPLAPLTTTGQQNPERDSIHEVSVRTVRDEHGRLSVVGESVGTSPDGTVTSRTRVEYWPGDGRRVAATDLLPIVGDAHRAALKSTLAEDSQWGGGDGNGEDRAAPMTAADSELSAVPDELPAAAKRGVIEEPGEFNT